MPKKIIDPSEYEILYEHLERSEAMIAVDAAHVYGDVMAILYGEEWGKLKALYDRGDWPHDFEDQIAAIWKVFFPIEDLPYLMRQNQFANTIDIIVDGNKAAVVFQKIARHILDAIYEIDGENE